MQVSVLRLELLVEKFITELLIDYLVKRALASRSIQSTICLVYFKLTPSIFEVLINDHRVHYLRVRTTFQISASLVLVHILLALHEFFNVFFVAILL